MLDASSLRRVDDKSGVKGARSPLLRIFTLLIVLLKDSTKRYQLRLNSIPPLSSWRMGRRESGFPQPLCPPRPPFPQVRFISPFAFQKTCRSSKSISQNHCSAINLPQRTDSFASGTQLPGAYISSPSTAFCSRSNQSQSR